MKYTREFWFLPSFDTSKGLNPIPPFNLIASTLNNAGWEIIEFQYENVLDSPSSYNTRLSSRLLIYATTTRKPKIDDPYAFMYKMTKNGLISEYEQRKQLKLGGDDLEYNLIFPTHNGKGSITNEELD